VLPSGLDLLSPNAKSGQMFSTPPVTVPGAAAATAQSLLAFASADGTFAAGALGSLLGASVRVTALQVRGLGFCRVLAEGHCARTQHGVTVAAVGAGVCWCASGPYCVCRTFPSASSSC
jgi:hypothetical protein